MLINRSNPGKSCLAILGRTFSLLVVGRKVQAHTVDAVALIRGCGIALALEDMAQMSTTVGADNFRSRHA